MILRWIATQFQTQRRYSEREVNQLLGHYHEHVATMRGGWLQRENHIYWKVDSNSPEHQGLRAQR